PVREHAAMTHASERTLLPYDADDDTETDALGDTNLPLPPAPRVNLAPPSPLSEGSAPVIPIDITLRSHAEEPLTTPPTHGYDDTGEAPCLSSPSPIIELTSLAA